MDVFLFPFEIKKQQCIDPCPPNCANIILLSRQKMAKTRPNVMEYAQQWRQNQRPFSQMWKSVIKHTTFKDAVPCIYTEVDTQTQAPRNIQFDEVFYDDFFEFRK